jgi:hypothetical protein
MLMAKSFTYQSHDINNLFFEDARMQQVVSALSACGHTPEGSFP